MTTLGLRPSGRLGLSPRRRRPLAPPFSPDQLTDLAFWYKAGDPQNTTAGGAVQQAFDLSGNGRHAAQSTSSARPLDATDADGSRVMRFDGTDDALLVPSFALGEITVFMAYRVREHVNGAGIITAGKAGAGSGANDFFAFAHGSSANTTQLLAKQAQASPLTTAGRSNALGDKEYVVFKIPAASGEVRDFNSTVTGSSTSVAMGTPDNVIIGASALDQFATAPFAKIDLYEIGLYTRALSTAELDQLEGYLRARHGISWSPGYLHDDLAWWHDDWSAFTLSGALVDQWTDRSGNGRHWTAAGGARPSKTTDAGNIVVRFDGVDDVLQMAGTKPVLEPFTTAAVYRVRNRGDFEGVLSAAAGSGVDHQNFWTFENASALSNNLQLFGRSLEAGQQQLILIRADAGTVQIAIWTASAGTATLRDRTGQVTDGYGGSFGTPAAIVLGARYNAGPFNHAEVDVLGVVGATKVLSAVDQQNLIDWAGAKWGA
jgi:hypothetical protein